MSLGEILFYKRGYTPIPFIIAAIVLADPREDLVIFGGILMFIGELLRIAGVSYLGDTSRSEETDKNKLVTNGPFAHVRNPLYFGNMFLYMGASIVAGGWLPYMLYLVIIFFTIQYAIIIKYEEKRLKEMFQEEYTKYFNSVPRFFPRISPYPDTSKVKPDLAGAFTIEKITIAKIIGFLFLVLISWYSQTSGII